MLFGRREPGRRLPVWPIAVLALLCVVAALLNPQPAIKVMFAAAAVLNVVILIRAISEGSG